MVDQSKKQTCSAIERWTSSKKDIQGIVHCELLDNKQIIISNLYRNQLRRLKTDMDKKCPSLLNRNRVILQQYNVHLHIAQSTKGARLELIASSFTETNLMSGFLECLKQLFKNIASFYHVSKSKVGDLYRGWPKGSLFNSYYTAV